MSDSSYCSLWTQFLKHNPKDPGWFDRDRFILSAGHGSMLLYSLLHLTGYDLPLDELKRFRKLGSKTPGHPERGCTAGVEVATGPLGQGFGNGVGMAIADIVQVLLALELAKKSRVQVGLVVPTRALSCGRSFTSKTRTSGIHRHEAQPVHVRIAPEATDQTPEQTALDKKINQHFGGVVVRKDLVKIVKGNAIVPTYVLEYLLGQYAASDDEATIQAGIGSVRQILADHYVHRNQSELVKSTIRERGRHKIIDKVTVTLNEKDDVYEAEFANLGIRQVLVEPATVTAHQKLLVGGVWCICDIEYFHSEDARVVPWILGSIKPIQLSNFDFDGYVAARREFTTDEWIDLVIQSIGFKPELFGRRAKLIQLVRLIPFAERNYNLVELGPKGTGKSHIFSEFSPTAC